MEPLVVISSDCHAGLPPERYRDYVAPQYRETFDIALPIQLAEVRAMAKKFLIDDINEEWRQGRDRALSGAWDHDERLRVLDGDGIAGEIIFPDGITEMNMPPFGAGLSLPTDSRIVPELQWEGARAHNRWLAEFCAMAPERRAGVALAPICWDVDEALREIHWVREHGLRGILIRRCGAAATRTITRSTSRSGRRARTSASSSISTRARRRWRTTAIISG